MAIIIVLLFTFGVFTIESQPSADYEAGDIQHHQLPKFRSAQTGHTQSVAAHQGSCRYGDEPLVQRDLTPTDLVWIING